MKEFIEKLVSRLEEEIDIIKDEVYRDYEERIIEECAIENVIDIVNELAEEYNNGWIPCSERLPKEHDSIFAECKGTNKWNEAMFEKISDDVNVTVKYENGTVKTMTTHTIDGKWKIDSIVKCEVIAWQPLPQSYKAGD